MSILEEFIYWSKWYVQLIFGIFLLLVAALLFQRGYEMEGWVVLGVTAVLWVAINLLRWRTMIFLNELEFGPVFHRNGNFDRFIGPGHHVVIPWFKELPIRLKIKGNKAIGEGYFRTKDGVFVIANWESKYHFDLKNLLSTTDKEKRIEHGHSIKKEPYGKVIGLTQLAIRRVIEKKTAENIYETREEALCLDNLEKEVEKELKTLLKVKEPGSILTDKSGAVSFKQLTFPHNIEQVIMEKIERDIYGSQKPFGMPVQRPSMRNRPRPN